MKILVGYKGTDVGKDLMDIAVKHAKAFNGEILIVTSMVGGDKTERQEFVDAEKNLEFRRNEFARLKEHAGHGPIRTAECSVFGAESTLDLAKQSADGSLEKSFAANPDAEVQVMQIGDAYFVGIPGEIFVEYALNLKSRSPKKTFAICLANGELQGYVTTEDADGYEADNSTLSPETGDIIIDAAIDLINKIGV